MDSADLLLQNFSASLRTLRIAMVTETYPPEINGVASTLARFVGGLVERGHTVRLLRPRQPGDAPTASAAGRAGDAASGMPGLRERCNMLQREARCCTLVP